MNVPFIDFNPQYQEIKDEIVPGLTEVFEKGCFILGPPEKEFEKAFATYCDSKLAVGVNSGNRRFVFGIRRARYRPGR